MPYTIDTDRVQEAESTEVEDMTITLEDPELKFADIESAGGELPVVTFGQLFFLGGGAELPNKGVWIVADQSPTTSLIRARRLGPLQPETDLEVSDQAEIFTGGRVLLIDGVSLDPGQTEIDFTDVVVMDLSKAPTAPGGDGSPE